MLLLYIIVSFQSPFEVPALPVEGPYLSNNLRGSQIVAAED